MEIPFIKSTLILRCSRLLPELRQWTIERSSTYGRLYTEHLTKIYLGTFLIYLALRTKPRIQNSNT